MIEKVKAYEKQSDLARQTGIDDGEEETVLDLQVKKGMAKGWFGNLSVGGGAPLEKEGFDVAALYQVNASLNRFDEDKQFTIMGSASQSSGGMSGMGGMRMGGGVGMGMGGFGMGGGFGGMMGGGGGGVNKSYSGGTLVRRFHQTTISMRLAVALTGVTVTTSQAPRQTHGTHIPALKPGAEASVPMVAAATA